MNFKNIYDDLNFNLNIFNVNETLPKIYFEEFKILGIDKVYFSGDFPAIFFKEVNQFNDEVLKEIAYSHHLIWNYRKVMFLVVISSTEIRIYNCNKKPFNYLTKDTNLNSELEQIQIVREDINSLQIVKEFFSRIAVDSGMLWTTENPLREKIDIQQRIDRYLVKSLLNAAKKIKKLDLNDEIIHRLIMRSIFIMYLEDKGAAKETNLYKEINKHAESYLDILENKEDTYKLFNKLEEHFNGDVFPIIAGEEDEVNDKHLKLIKLCFLDGDLSENPKLFNNWRLFQFNIIQIELLSEIYENFLQEFKAIKKEEAGQYYTPPSLVELILNENLKVKNETNWEIKILDMSCGSGIFLVQSFQRLVIRWENAHPNQRIEFDNLIEILEKNIFGIEYDKLAIRVTAFSLYLAIVEHLNPKTLWINKKYKFPFLINDAEDNRIKKQGKNLFRADTIGQIEATEFPKVNLIVGNPPFGSKISLESIKKFCRHYNYGNDMVIPFLRKAINFTDDGSIALIFNTKILTNTLAPFQNFRKWLFNETYVEKIYNLSILRKTPKKFGGQLFTSAVGPISIIFYKKTFPVKQSATIEYWAPQTYLKNSMVEGVIIESADIKFLPRIECKKADSKIWKIGMWGTMEDFKFIEFLSTQFKSIGQYFSSKYDLSFGVGLELSNPRDKKNQDIRNYLHHNPDTLRKYYTEKSYATRINDIYFRRLGKTNAYKAPHLLIKEGIRKNKIIASYIDYDCSFYKGIIGVYSKTADSDGLKILNTYLNSKMIQYLVFLTTSSWGIERDVIKYKELFSLPYILPSINNLEKKLITISDRIVKNEKELLKTDVLNIIQNADELIFSNFSEEMRILIEDLIDYSLDLFKNGHKSIALKESNFKINSDYAHVLSKKLISFLGNEPTKLNIRITFYDSKKVNPLNMIKIQFDTLKNEIVSNDLKPLNLLLADIDKFMIQRKSQSIYLRKIIKYYDGDTIYIIKPNQRRYWSRSRALNDANDMISEILNMK